jgi:GAF domain-containing protein
MIEPGIATQLLQRLRESEASGAALRRVAMQLLDELPTYDWSGIYRLEGDTLILDEYVGAETDHTHIPVGRGVCGTAVAEDKNQVIEDVRNLQNYLACSTQTRSEIVILIRDDAGQVLGQIDIDGHQVGAFDASDEALLEDVAKVLAERW